MEVTAKEMEKKLPVRSEERRASVTLLKPNEERISRGKEQPTVSNDSNGSSKMRRLRIDDWT